MAKNKQNPLITVVKTNRSFLLFITLMLVFRSAVADWNDVPTGSMKPTIVEGDRIFVNKMAYDLRLPFTHISLKKIADPKHNDIIIFDSKSADKRLVKRVIGLPGDLVAMQNNQLMINGTALNYQKERTTPKIYTEFLFSNHHHIQVSNNSSPYASFAQVKVPADHYLVLGDNRNNSVDSRVIGFVPRNEIIGRSNKVVLSLNYDNYFIPRAERFWLTI